MKLYFKFLVGLIAITIIISFSFIIYAFKNKNSSDLKLCGFGITYPYYITQNYYKKDFFHFKEYIESKFNIVSNENEIIVRIQFMINCTGEVGNFKSQIYDFNYQPIPLNTDISNQFIKLINEYQFWGTPKDRTGKAVNIYKFYAFKINENQIIEILPK